MKTRYIIAAIAVIYVAAPEEPKATATQPPAISAIQSGYSPVTHAETEGLNPELRWRVDMVLVEGNGRLTMGDLSGKRSREEQAEMVRRHEAGVGAPADSPDESTHVTGDAADIQCSAENAGLRAELAKKYGLYAPYADEPWHFELGPNGQAA